MYTHENLTNEIKIIFPKCIVIDLFLYNFEQEKKILASIKQTFDKISTFCNLYNTGRTAIIVLGFVVA